MRSALTLPWLAAEGQGVTAGLLPCAGEVCAALSVLSEQIELEICQPAPNGDSLVDVKLLKNLGRAWENCSGTELMQHTSLPYVEQLLAAAASMVRIAAALGGWQQESR